MRPFRLTHSRANPAEPGAIGVLLDVGGQPKIQAGAVTFDHDDERLTRTLAHDTHPVRPTRDRFAICLDYAIPGTKTVSLRGTPRLDSPDHGRERRPGRSEPEALEEPASGQVIDSDRSEVDDTFLPAVRSIDDFDPDFPLVERSGDDRLHRRLPRRHLPALHRLHLVARLEPRTFSDGTGAPAWSTIGRSPSTPIMYMHQYARIANRKLNAGPATTTATRVESGWRLNARWRSCVATFPSDSSSIFT